MNLYDRTAKEHITEILLAHKNNEITITKAVSKIQKTIEYVVNNRETKDNKGDINTNESQPIGKV